METVVPKVGGRVRILRGAHENQTGVVLEKDNKKGEFGEALVEFSNVGNPVWFSYDDVCELVSR